MSAEKLTSAKLAEILQIQPSSISHLLSGRNKPGFEFISKLMLMFPELNPDWFINGQGDMYRRHNNSVTAETTEKVTNLTSTSHNASHDPQGELFSSITNVNQVDIPNEISEVLPLEAFDIHKPKCDTNKTATDEFVDRDTDGAEKIVIFYPDNSFEIFHQRK